VAAHTDDMAAVVEPGDDEEPPQAARRRGVASAIAGVGDKQASVGRELWVDRKPRQPERPTCKIEDGPIAVDLQRRSGPRAGSDASETLPSWV